MAIDRLQQHGKLPQPNSSAKGRPGNQQVGNGIAVACPARQWYQCGRSVEPGKDADAPVLEVADEPPGPLPGFVGNILLLRVGQPLSRQVQEQPRLVPLDQDLEGRVYLPARASLQLAHEGGVVRRLARR